MIKSTTVSAANSITSLKKALGERGVSMKSMNSTMLKLDGKLTDAVRSIIGEISLKFNSRTMSKGTYIILK